MRAYEIFARMTPERATELLEVLRAELPGVYTQAVAAASVAIKARPRFLLSQPAEKRAQLVRRALARVAANDLAEEVLAAYFLEARKPLLVEWLDAVEIPHKDGVLEAERPACPPKEKLEAAVTAFLADEGAADRTLLLQAFAAQSAVDWPELEALLAARGPAA
jgi:hypothetical protein